MVDIIRNHENSRVVKFRYDLLNRNNLKIGEIPEVLSSSVSLNSLAEIKRTARFTIKENIARDIDYLNDRLKPVFILDSIEYPLGIYLLPSPRKNDTKEGIIREIEGYDVSQILKEDRFTDRYFVAEKFKYTNIITQLINSAGIYDVDIYPSNAELARDREWEIGTSKLTVINELLSEMNYTSIYTDERGIVTAKPYLLPNSREVKHVYTSSNSRIVANTASDELDLFNVPNVWVVVATNAEGSNMVSKYENKHTGSPTSTVRRNRNIVDYREVSDIASQEALDDYVKRIAYIASSTYNHVEFTTLLMPKHDYSDAIYLEHKKLKVEGKYIETAWTMELKAGGSMTHSARKVVFI